MGYTADSLTKADIEECMRWAVQTGRYLLVEACAVALVRGKRRPGARADAKRRVAAALNARTRRERGGGR